MKLHLLSCAIAHASFVLLCFAACSSGPAGGPVTGSPDSHCGTTAVVISQAACTTLPPEPDGGVDAGHVHEPEPMFNTSGADDDCKYDVSWTSSPIRKGDEVTFTVTVKARAGGAVVTGAEPELEAFLGDTHPAPNTNPTTTEAPAGTYKITPIKFDASGQWTIRFHFFDSCLDSETSPHGHAGFYITVP